MWSLTGAWWPNWVEKPFWLGCHSGLYLSRSKNWQLGSLGCARVGPLKLGKKVCLVEWPILLPPPVWSPNSRVFFHPKYIYIYIYLFVLKNTTVEILFESNFLLFLFLKRHRYLAGTVAHMQAIVAGHCTWNCRASQAHDVRLAFIWPFWPMH
jgi:hypothetical protein